MIALVSFILALLAPQASAVIGGDLNCTSYNGTAVSFRDTAAFTHLKIFSLSGTQLPLHAAMSSPIHPAQFCTLPQLQLTDIHHQEEISRDHWLVIRLLPRLQLL